MPTEESGVSPLEVWSRTKSNHHDLLHTHSWGCPAYVLSPRLREGGNVLKWEPRSKRGQFVGYSPLHASSVGMIRNINTQYVSPQFHVMYDNFFEMVHSDEGNLLSAKIWEALYTFEHYKVDWDQEPPDLAEEWLLPGEKQSRVEQLRGSMVDTAVPLGPPLQRERAGQACQANDQPGPPAAQEVEAPSSSQAPAQDTMAADPGPPSPPNPPPVRQSTRRTRGMAPQRMTYEVRGQPTSYFLSETFQQMILGLVACVDQREHFQREFLAMMMEP